MRGGRRIGTVMAHGAEVAGPRPRASPIERAATISASMPFGFLFRPRRQINAKEVNRVRARKGQPGS
jgi:hypothetical protein